MAPPATTTPQISNLRRAAGILALLAAALMVDPLRSVGSAANLGELNWPMLQHAFVVPALALLGLWLVFANLTVTTLCVLLLSIAHSAPGSADLFQGYLYPALAVVSGLMLLHALTRRAPDAQS